MSEIKGTLLSVILALTVFGLVFGALTVAVRSSAKDVAERITTADEMEIPPEEDDEEEFFVPPADGQNIDGAQ